jgi:hypothetical protein
MVEKPLSVAVGTKDGLLDSESIERIRESSRVEEVKAEVRFYRGSGMFFWG